MLGLTLSEAVDKMRGPVGSKIKLTIVREGADAPIDVEVTRAVIKIKSVRYHEEGDVGYIRITSFNEQTDSGLKEALKDIKSKLGKSLKGYIIDLRNNPGGLLDQAIAVSDDFLDRGEIVQTRGRDNRDIQRYNATSGDLTGGKTLVVLINGGSASASEIVSGALQDHKRALIVGTRSFGKGSVQTIIPLGTNGALRLTTARYYTPSGRSIQAKGIEPDVMVQQLRLAGAQPVRYQRNEASLPGHLANPDDAKAKDKDGKDKNGKDGDKGAALPAPDKTNGNAGDAAKDNAKVDDYQLSFAIDLLRGIAISQQRNGG